MPSASPTDPQASRLQPAGRRWGFGAHSVVPYLVHSMQAPGTGPAGDAGIRNPVFPQMEHTLRPLRGRH